MTVIVNQKVVVRGINHLEATSRAAEAFEAGRAFGHVETKVLLPVGAKVDLVTEGRDALMVWGHI
jgi:hypothetical protein